MWHITNQAAIEQLNEAINIQWKLVAYLESLCRWNSMKADIARLRENTEEISRCLNEALQYERI